MCVYGKFIVLRMLLYQILLQWGHTDCGMKEATPRNDTKLLAQGQYSPETYDAGFQPKFTDVILIEILCKHRLFVK